MNIAFEMINLAKDAGADAIKFQIFSPSDLILKNVKKLNIKLVKKIIMRTNIKCLIG